MTGTLIDTFLSPNGRIDRRTWWGGIIATAAAGLIGTSLMNADSFDESANAVSAAPTMAAFLWAALAAYVATVLILKRLEDGGAPKILGVLFAAAAGTILIGWGVGAFAEPFAVSPMTALLWSLVLGMIPALFEAARRPTRAPVSTGTEGQPA